MGIAVQITMGRGYCYECMAMKRVGKTMTTFTGTYFPKANKEVHDVEWPLMEKYEALERYEEVERGRKAKEEEAFGCRAPGHREGGGGGYGA